EIPVSDFIRSAELMRPEAHIATPIVGRRTTSAPTITEGQRRALPWELADGRPTTASPLPCLGGDGPSGHSLAGGWGEGPPPALPPSRPAGSSRATVSASASRCRSRGGVNASSQWMLPI